MKITKNSSKKEIRKEFDECEVKYGTIGVAEVFEEKIYEISVEIAGECEDILEIVEETIDDIWSKDSEFENLGELISSKIQ